MSIKESRPSTARTAVLHQNKFLIKSAVLDRKHLDEKITTSCLKVI
jgi:hypothetical protein